MDLSKHYWRSTYRLMDVSKNFWRSLDNEESKELVVVGNASYGSDSCSTTSSDSRGLDFFKPPIIHADIEAAMEGLSIHNRDFDGDSLPNDSDGDFGDMTPVRFVHTPRPVQKRPNETTVEPKQEPKAKKVKVEATDCPSTETPHVDETTSKDGTAELSSMIVFLGLAYSKVNKGKNTPDGASSRKKKSKAGTLLRNAEIAKKELIKNSKNVMTTAMSFLRRIPKL